MVNPDLENQEPRDEHIFIQNNDHPNHNNNNSNHNLNNDYKPDINHKDHPISKIITEGDYITFGNEKYKKSDLMEAFGGTLNPGLSPPPKNDFANPAPLGLSAFALTTFVLSLINCGARGVKIPNIVVGLAFFYGGAAQLIAGLLEIGVGNTFGGVALSSYGGFWLSWAAIHVESFGIYTAYEGKESEFANALGIYLVGWFIFTFFLMIMTLKSTVAFFSVFFFLTITFLLLAIAEFSGKISVKTTAGVFGLITAFCAWYCAYAGLANRQNSYITVKAVQLPDLESKWKKN
ncbi:uncharacterized protein KGF55_000483 [Candida pseudojiufengensis]|uniref:uncharacterized protein n=1 Tax=Candida pseudojiufengensis TaxID=497109 RepID=UPI002224F7FA|nr:uncharacterized protein KGF55_000483 [Candida pseudojiufengensis]KAI5966174.1 hypothetical protein KGF55_000483 [Candida pseudojiufengensis]